MAARPCKVKTESADEGEKRTTYTLNPLALEFIPRAREKMALPVEVLVKKPLMAQSKFLPFPVEIWAKIFNCLSNRDIRCGISLSCTRFHEICQDKSLVPVRDLCIYGDKNESYWLSDFVLDFLAVSDIIFQSKNLTTLKIIALHLDIANTLVSKALRACPKLNYLQIAETPEMTKYQDDDVTGIFGLRATEEAIPFAIKKFGKQLRHINLLLNSFDEYGANSWRTIGFREIINGCPNLKSLSIGSHSLDHSDLVISEGCLKSLSESCKELRDLKITKAKIGLCTGSLVEEIMLNCKVEIKECQFFQVCEDECELLQVCEDCGLNIDIDICTCDDGSY